MKGSILLGCDKIISWFVGWLICFTAYLRRIMQLVSSAAITNWAKNIQGHHHLIILSCHQHGSPWPSLATPPYRSSLLAGPQGYILNPNRAVGRPAFARPCDGVHKSTSLMSSSLILQQCPACLVLLTLIVFVMGGWWPYSWCFVGVASSTVPKFINFSFFLFIYSSLDIASVSIFLFFMNRLIIPRLILSVTVIVVMNRIHDRSWNSVQGCLRFPLPCESLDLICSSASYG